MEKLTDFYISICHNFLIEYSKVYFDILDKVNTIPTTESEYDEYNYFIKSLDDALKSLERKNTSVGDKLELLKYINYSIPYSEFLSFWSNKTFVIKILQLKQKNEVNVERKKNLMIANLEAEQDKFMDYLEICESDLTAIFSYGEWEKVEKVYDIVTNLENKLIEAQEKVELFEKRGKIFDMKAKNYSRLDFILETFKPHLELWTAAANFKASSEFWLGRPIIELKGCELEKTMTQSTELVTELYSKLNKKYQHPSSLAKQLLHELDNFKKYIPIVKALSSDALEERNWTDISDICGIQLIPNEVTLTGLKSVNFFVKWDEIEEISRQAENEYKYKLLLDNLMNYWDDVLFDFVPFLDTGSSIINNLYEIKTEMDEQLIKVQTILVSPDLQLHKAKCLNWEKKLIYGVELLTELMSCQKTWMFLVPIFQSNDIRKELLTETMHFLSVDMIWRITISELLMDNRVYSIFNSESNLEKLRSANQLTEIINKGFLNYIEKKRSIFPRFYFLSNVELLDILSKSQNKSFINSDLSNFFSGIKNVITDPDETENSFKIIGVNSISGEKVKLVHSINPIEYGKIMPLEKWLNKLEITMKETMENNLINSLVEYDTVSRDEWMSNWPIQIIIKTIEIKYTERIINAIMKENTSFSKIQNDVKEDISEMKERKNNGNSALYNNKINTSLITLIYIRDIINQLAEKKVHSTSAFDWIVHLRYYMKRISETRVKLVIEMMYTEIEYGYEFLDNSSRLILTPLTLKSMRILMEAIEAMYGGCNIGNSVTGKREIIEDLSKTVGLFCLVLKCNIHIDYILIEKYIKGILASGNWLIFDNINKLELNILGMLSQQVYNIMNCKRQLQNRIIIGDTNVPLDKSCHIFITLNPFLMNCAPLPESLKNLFRSCVLIQPDICYITEVELEINGFNTSYFISRKMKEFMECCKTQFVSNKIYNFGLNSIFNIIKYAQYLKGQNEEWSEDELIYNSIKHIYSSQMTSDDFIQLMFTLHDYISIENNDLKDMSEEYIKELGDLCVRESLIINSDFIKYVININDIIQIQSGIILFGDSFSFKSTAFNIFQKLVDDSEKNQSVVIHPMSYTLEQMYGFRDKQTGEWSGGIFTNLFINRMEEIKYIIFDGPMQSEWIEFLGSVFDSKKEYFVNTSETVEIAKNLKIVFETDSMVNMNPSAICRLGLIYFECNNRNWDLLNLSYFSSLIKTNSSLFKWLNTEFINKIKDYIKWLFPPLLVFLSKKNNLILDISLLEIVSSFFKVFHSFMQSDILVKEYHEMAPDIETIENILIISILNSYGLLVNDESRIDFNKILLLTCSGTLKNDVFFQEFLNSYRDCINYDIEESTYENRLIVELPSVYLFDYYYDIENDGWEPYQSFNYAQIPLRSSNFNNILIHCLETKRIFYIFDKMIKNHNFLFYGPTGTGKTTIINSYIANLVNESKLCLSYNFQYNMTCDDLYSFIQTKTIKRNAFDYGAAIGRRLFLFIDDLNYVKKNKYGIKPEIECLRQLINTNSFFDTKSYKRMFLKDTRYIASMTSFFDKNLSRFTRYFNIIGLVSYESNSLFQIFNSIMNIIVKKFIFLEMSNVDIVSNSTIALFSSISSVLQPSPLKPQYCFNIRDILRIYSGIFNCDVESIKTLDMFNELWSFECYRVFYDRLASEEDRSLFDSAFDLIALDYFQKTNYSANFRNITSYFGIDFSEPKFPYKFYSDTTFLNQVADEKVVEYNKKNNSKNTFILVRHSLEYIIRITRIIRQVSGHCVLFGDERTGKKTLVKLSVLLIQNELYSINLTKSYDICNFNDDMKKMLKIAGLKNKNVVLLLTENQIVDDIVLDSISQIINIGYVYNIFSKEDYNEISTELSDLINLSDIISKNIQQAFEIFNKRTKNNVKIILCLKTAESIYNKRLINYPFILKNCSFIWVPSLQKDAYETISKAVFKNVDMKAEIKEEAIKSVVNMEIELEEMNNMLKKEKNYSIFLSPDRFISFLTYFLSLYKTHYRNIMNHISSNENRDKILNKIEDAIKFSENELIKSNNFSPLEENAVTEKMFTELDEYKREMDTKGQEMHKKEAILEKLVKELDIYNKMIDFDENIIETDTKSILQISNSIEKQEIISFINNKEVSIDSKKAIYALCILLKLQTFMSTKLSDEVYEDNWRFFIKYLKGNPKIIDKINEKRVAEINSESIEVIRELDLKYQTINEDNSFIKFVFKWIESITDFFDKKQKNMQTLANKSKILEKKKNLEEKLLKLNEEFNRIKEKHGSIESEIEIYLQKKIDNDKIIDEYRKNLKLYYELKTELNKDFLSWDESTKRLNKKREHLVGDMLICAGIIEYMGYYPISYRIDYILKFKEILRSNNIETSEDIKLSKIISKDVTIQSWMKSELPNNIYSVENMIIVNESRKYSLMIDPQGIVNRWIKRYEKSNDLLVINHCSKSYNRILENAIQFGLPLLIEDIESVDINLYSLLSKEYINVGDIQRVKVIDSTVTINPAFRLYMTTRESKAHYNCDIHHLVNIIIFETIPEGLGEMLYNEILETELNDIYKKRLSIENDEIENNSKRNFLEDDLLQLLRTKDTIILNDQMMMSQIITTNQNKYEAISKADKIKVSFIEINKYLLKYEKIVTRLYLIFESLSQIVFVNPLYQFSYDWFIEVLKTCLIETRNHYNNKDRENFLVAELTYAYHKNLSLLLLSEHKLLFPFYILMKVCYYSDELSEEIISFFLLGSKKKKENSKDSEITSLNIINEIDGLVDIEIMKNFPKLFYQKRHQFEKAMKSEDFLSQLDLLCEEFTFIQKIIVVKILRQDKLLEIIKETIKKQLGKRFIKAAETPLIDIYSISTPHKPTIIYYDEDLDLIGEIERVSKKLKISSKLFYTTNSHNISEFSENAIQKYINSGYWVIIQNCCTSNNWIIEIERIMNDIRLNSNCDPAFKIWLLVKNESNIIPSFFLQKCLRYNISPPNDIVTNLRFLYSSIDPEYLESSKKPKEFKKLLFGLSLFHSVIKSRQKSQNFGWIFEMDISEVNYSLSRLFITKIINESDSIDFESLYYKICELIYCGISESESDTETIYYTLTNIISREIFFDKYSYSGDIEIKINGSENLADFKSVIDSLPFNLSLSDFGYSRNEVKEKNMIDYNKVNLRLIIVFAKYNKVKRVID